MRTGGSDSKDPLAERSDPLAETVGQRLDLFDLLGTVDEFGEASLALIAWEFGLAEARLAGIWSRATADGLIERLDVTADASEQMFSLTPRGLRHLHGARQQSRADLARARVGG